MTSDVTTEAGRALPSEPLSAAAETKLRAVLERLLTKSGYLTGCEQMNARLLATLASERQSGSSSHVIDLGSLMGAAETVGLRMGREWWVEVLSEYALRLSLVEETPNVVGRNPE